MPANAGLTAALSAVRMMSFMIWTVVKEEKLKGCRRHN
jgi:hypothetical protein